MQMFSAHNYNYQGRCVSCAQVAVLGHPWACLSICVRSWEVGTQALVGSRFMGSPGRIIFSSSEVAGGWGVLGPQCSVLPYTSVWGLLTLRTSQAMKGT